MQDNHRCSAFTKAYEMPFFFFYYLKIVVKKDKTVVTMITLQSCKILSVSIINCCVVFGI